MGLVTVNGVAHHLPGNDETPLLDVLRATLKLTGTRFGCGAGQCGACMVLLDGYAVPSCTTPVWSAEGKEVTTVEGLGTPERPHPLQAAFLEHQAGQCGYCWSGVLISAAALLRRQQHPDEAEIRAALDRNLCRCGAHNRMVRAVQAACR